MQGYNKGFLYFICAVSAMGGLLFGYDWVVIGGAKPFYELFFGISDSPVMQGVAMTTALIGCLAGAMVAGAAADKYGRKPLLITSAVLFTVSAIATGLFNDFTLFNIARFVGGIGIGVASALAPMYIAEVSPADIRGRMVSLNQMTIVLGILAAQILGDVPGHFAVETDGAVAAARNDKTDFLSHDAPAGLNRNRRLDHRMRVIAHDLEVFELVAEDRVGSAADHKLRIGTGLAR